MTVTYLSVGSNIEPEKNIPASIELLNEHFNVIKVSAIYETEPVGPAGGFKFWNYVVSIKSSLSRERMHDKLRDLEKKLGRKRSPGDKFAPRTIDIDALPQENYQRQAFIMIPLAEIAPEGWDQEKEMKFVDLAKQCEGQARSFRKIELNGN